VRGCVDADGFVKVRKTLQLDSPGLEHIFAGGDICVKEMFTSHERTASQAAGHAYAIVANIVTQSGSPHFQGKLYQPRLNQTAGLEGIIVSMGTAQGLLFATEPNFEGFFASAEALRAERGGIADAGDRGWIEMNPGMDYFKFSMMPGNFARFLNEGWMDSMDQFYGRSKENKIVPIE
jgi:hypothetical protein